MNMTYLNSQTPQININSAKEIPKNIADMGYLEYWLLNQGSSPTGDEVYQRQKIIDIFKSYGERLKQLIEMAADQLSDPEEKAKVRLYDELAEIYLQGAAVVRTNRDPSKISLLREEYLEKIVAKEDEIRFKITGERFDRLEKLRKHREDRISSCGKYVFTKEIRE